MEITLELHFDGEWHRAAEIEIFEKTIDQGVECAETQLNYRQEYIANHLFEKHKKALSCRYPVDFNIHLANTGPPFLFDFLPQGAARKYWTEELKIPNDARADALLLQHAAGNPPGNLRVALPEGVPGTPVGTHVGFSREEVIEKNEGFIRYAKECGAPAGGSSGAGGAAPKFLLSQDKTLGNWHADGALPDETVARHWLVKFPRGSKERDRMVLRNEAPYLEIARWFGLRVAEPLVWEDDVLFVPRFDRRNLGSGIVERHGLESLASLIGVTRFGARGAQEDLCAGIKKYCQDSKAELLEFVKRDLLNLAMGNTDNHARNTSVIKRDGEDLQLSPLYDFAPMYLDPEGIARVCQWEHERAGLPEWELILKGLSLTNDHYHFLRAGLLSCVPLLEKLVQAMAEEKIDDEMIERVASKVPQLVKTLEVLNE